ncbi:MAG: SGNH/GDSL hydrolase family protein [Candidatus Omnitrophota bacterium]
MNFLKNLFVSCLSLVLFLGLIEGGFRVYHWFQYGTSQFHTRWFRVAEIGGWHEPEPGIINTLGFHNEEFSPVKPKDTFRVVVLGGSTVYGEEAIESSWTWNLSEYIKTLPITKKVQVINAGISAGTSSEEMKSLRKIIFLKPDLILVYDGWNDIYTGHYAPEDYEGRRPNYGAKEKMDEFKLFLMSHSVAYSYYFRRMEKAWSRSLRKTWKGLIGKKKKEASAPPSIQSREETPAQQTSKAQVTKQLMIWDQKLDYAVEPERPVEDRFSPLYETNLRAMKALSDRHHVPIVFFFQPNLAYNCAVKTVSEAARIILKDRTGVLCEDWIRASSVLYPIALKTHEKLRQEGFMDYDLTGMFDGKEETSFSDSVHQFPGEPMKEIARTVAQILLSRNLLPVTSRRS